MLCDYGAIAIVLSVSLVGFFQLVNQSRPRAALTWSTLCVVHILAFLLQIYFVYQSSHYRPEKMGYISVGLNLSFTATVRSFWEILTSSLSNSQRIPAFMAVLYTVGMALAARTRRWDVFGIGGLVPVVYVGMSQASLYPLMRGRHTLLLSVICLIAICYGVACCAQHCKAHSRAVCVCLSLCLACVLYTSQISFRYPQKIMQPKPGLFEVGFTASGFNRIGDFIRGAPSHIDGIITNYFVEDFFLKNEQLAPQLVHTYRSLPKFYCSGEYFSLAQPAGFIRCLRELQRQGGEAVIGKRFVYLLTSFDPRSVASKDPAGDVLFEQPMVARVSKDQSYFISSFTVAGQVCPLR
jgi:hypothetical protein